MGPNITPGRPRSARRPGGYALLILLFAITLMSFGLTIALPVWETQMQREKEAELIFRGKQFVEAVRIYQLKNPGAFPKTLDELVEKKCLRRLYRDPMTEDGKWNVVLQQEGFGGMSPGIPGAPGRESFRPGMTEIGPGMEGQEPGAVGQEDFRGGAESEETGEAPSGASGQKVLVAPVAALSSIQNPRIIGVVSSSTRKSIRIYNEQESYDKWLFFFGQDPKNVPEIIYYGKPEKES